MIITFPGLIVENTCKKLVSLISGPDSEHLWSGQVVWLFCIDCLHFSNEVSSQLETV